MVGSMMATGPNVQVNTSVRPIIAGFTEIGGRCFREKLFVQPGLAGIMESCGRHAEGDISVPSTLYDFLTAGHSDRRD